MGDPPHTPEVWLTEMMNALTMTVGLPAEDSTRRPACLACGDVPPEPEASSPLPGSAAAHAARRCAMMLSGRSAVVALLAEEHVLFVVRAPPDRRAMRQRVTPRGHTARLGTTAEHTPTNATPTRPPASPGSALRLGRRPRSPAALLPCFAAARPPVDASAEAGAPRGLLRHVSQGVPAPLPAAC